MFVQIQKKRAYMRRLTDQECTYSASSAIIEQPVIRTCQMSYNNSVIFCCHHMLNRETFLRNAVISGQGCKSRSVKPSRVDWQKQCNKLLKPKEVPCHHLKVLANFAFFPVGAIARNISTSYVRGFCANTSHIA